MIAGLRAQARDADSSRGPSSIAALRRSEEHVVGSDMLAVV
jgi:hypothetical protein